MDLRLLETFVAVADQGTVSAAAAGLHITQPALSRQLQRLERDLGLALFRRKHSRLLLTAAGRRFLDSAREVLASAERARSVATALAAGRVERLRAAAPTTTLTDIVAPFLASLAAEDPMITVEEAPVAAALAGLHRHLDLVIVSSPPPTTLAQRRVADLPVWAQVRADHPLATHGTITLEQLASERILTLDSTSRPRHLLHEALGRAGLAAPDIVECPNPQVGQALAAAGHGVALLSDDPRFDLVPLSVATATAPLTLTLFAAWSPDHHAASTIAALVDRLVDFCHRHYPQD